MNSFCSGLFFDKHLKYIKLNEKKVEFTKMDLTYLLKVNMIRLRNFYNIIHSHYHLH